MFQFQNIWLPDGEKHFPDWMARNGELVNGKGTYQIRKFREAMKHVKQFRTAIDVGAHVGLWSMHLVERFNELHAFEPIPQFRDCWRANLPGALLRVALHDCALGNQDGELYFALNHADTGDTHVADFNKAFPQVRASITKLDNIQIQDVDFIKIDCEGFEEQVIIGGAETIARCKPCIIVEQKQHKMAKNYGTKGTPAVDLLKKMGAVLRREMGGDYILSWD